MQKRFFAPLICTRQLFGLSILTIIAAAHCLSVAGATESKNSTSCKLEQVGEYPLLENEWGMPIVVVTIDGKPLRMLLDTGGYWSLLDPRLTTDYSIKTSQFELRLGLNGIPLNKVVHINLIQLGIIDFSRGSFFIAPPGYLGNDVDGTLGANILNVFDVEIDPGAMKVFFFSKEHCPGKVIHWKHSDLAVLPFHVITNQNLLTVPIRLDGQEVTAMIDTGTSSTVLSATKAVNSFGIELPSLSKDTKTPSNKAQISSIFSRQFQTLEFAGIKFENPRLSVASIYDPHIETILGMHHLRTLHMYFAYDEEKLYLTSVRGDEAAQDGAGGAEYRRDAKPDGSDQGKRADQLARAQAQDLAQSAMDAIKAKNYSLAEADIYNALKLDKDSSQAYIVRTQLDLIEKKADQALADINEALRLDPDNIAALRFRTLYEEKIGEYSGALRDADHFLKLQPHSPESLNLRCWILAVIGQDLDIALSDCNAAIALNPKSYSTLNSRALVNLKSSRIDEAIKDYDASLALAPKFAASLYGRGVAKERAGDISGAKIDMDAALALDSKIAQSFGK